MFSLLNQGHKYIPRPKKPWCREFHRDQLTRTHNSGWLNVLDALRGAPMGAPRG